MHKLIKLKIVIQKYLFLSCSNNMECILENEDNNLKMAEIASNLGVTPSSFLKNIKKMTEKDCWKNIIQTITKKMLSSAYHHSVETLRRLCPFCI